ncbi:UNVERIFIED_CONTAM: hypothetical protein NCL1_17226 [Trichonephila clavipes]
MMKKFEATCSLSSHQRSGGPSITAAVATIVEQTVQSILAIAAHGKCSAREISRQTGVSYGSVWKTLRITLRRYPHKLQHNQELKPPDFDSHRDFVNLVFSKMEEQHDWLRSVLWTDEVHFTLSGEVITHNCRMWTTENPHAFVQSNIIPELEARLTLQIVTFTQEGAPPHIALHVQRLLRSAFGDARIISRYFNHAWPPRSPDLTIVNFGCEDS